MSITILIKCCVIYYLPKPAKEESTLKVVTVWEMVHCSKVSLSH